MNPPEDSFYYGKNYETVSVKLCGENCAIFSGHTGVY